MGCDACGGRGYRIVCIDDLCRGAGECMHGDGEIPCDCEDDEDDDWEPDDEPRCACPYCHCVIATNGEICRDCLEGAHQG